jgi:hypothetical protein
VFSLYSESNVPLCMQSKQKQMSSGYRGLEIMHKCRYGWLKGNQGSLNSNKQINSKMHKIASDNSIMGVYSLYVQGTVYSVIQQLHKCQDLQAPGRPTVRQTPELDREPSRSTLAKDWTITAAIFLRLDRFLKPLAGPPSSKVQSWTGNLQDLPWRKTGPSQ